MPLAPNTTILNGKYRILELIGEGGMARVWLAEEPKFAARHVTIKEPKRFAVGFSQPELEQRFRQEIAIAEQLRQHHARHVVLAHTVEEYEGMQLLVMPHMAGGSLANKLKHAPEGLPWQEAVRIVLQVLEGLQALHELDIVHRDVKPSNILFDDRGEASLADFGVAQVRGVTVGRSMMLGGPHPGDPDYAAPEQMRNDGGYLTPAADVYSLGAVLFEMLTGKKYRAVAPGMRPEQLRAGVPAWLDSVIMKALAPDPAQRWQDGEAFLIALKKKEDALVAGYPSGNDQVRNKHAGTNKAETKKATSEETTSDQGSSQQGATKTTDTLESREQRKKPHQEDDSKDWIAQAFFGLAVSILVAIVFALLADIDRSILRPAPVVGFIFAILSLIFGYKSNRTWWFRTNILLIALFGVLMILQVAGRFPPRKPSLIAVIDMPDSTHVGRPVDFDASQSVTHGASVRYHWDFDDGTEANGVRVRHTFWEPGKYTIQLTIRTDDGQQDATAQVLLVQKSATTPSPSSTIAVESPTAFPSPILAVTSTPTSTPTLPPPPIITVTPTSVRIMTNTPTPTFAPTAINTPMPTPTHTPVPQPPPPSLHYPAPELHSPPPDAHFSATDAVTLTWQDLELNPSQAHYLLMVKHREGASWVVTDTTQWAVPGWMKDYSPINWQVWVCAGGQVNEDGYASQPSDCKVISDSGEIRQLTFDTPSPNSTPDIVTPPPG